MSGFKQEILTSLRANQTSQALSSTHQKDTRQSGVGADEREEVLWER